MLEIEALGLAPASEEVLREKWEVEDVRALIHNLNDLYRADPGVKAAAVLGEFEDMLHVWCINKATLPTLLDRGFLGRADNLPTLRVIADVSS